MPDLNPEAAKPSTQAGNPASGREWGKFVAERLPTAASDIQAELAQHL